MIDVVVRHGAKAYSFYEIKTALSAAACIREALGQVLEYAYWPGGQEPKCIVICGEGRLEKDAKAYLCRLKDKFGLPLAYEQVVLDAKPVCHDQKDHEPQSEERGHRLHRSARLLGTGLSDLERRRAARR